MTAPYFVDAQTTALAPAVLTRLTSPVRTRIQEFVRYFGCSGVALTADVGIYSVALGRGITYPVAAAAGFAVGLCIAYGLSVRYVFRERSLTDAKVEFAVFAGIGLMGLLLTELLLCFLIGRFDVQAHAAKLAAAGAVFGSTFFFRKLLLFRRRQAHISEVG